MPEFNGRYETAGRTAMRLVRGWIYLSVALAMLSQPGAGATNKDLEALFGAWGRVDDNPKARGCRLYADGVEGDYFVLNKDYVETGWDCVCMLEGSRPLDACFEINLFCRCDDGITVRRRYLQLCPTEAASRLDVTENGEAISYERCKGGR